MKYELNIFIDFDDKNDTATLSVNGVNNENEEANFLFTDNQVATSLYNQIIMDIYKAVLLESWYSLFNEDMIKNLTPTNAKEPTEV